MRVPGGQCSRPLILVRQPRWFQRLRLCFILSEVFEYNRSFGGWRSLDLQSRRLNHWFIDGKFFLFDDGWNCLDRIYIFNFDDSKGNEFHLQQLPPHPPRVQQAFRFQPLELQAIRQVRQWASSSLASSVFSSSSSYPLQLTSLAGSTRR
jgi:hypothetical protein